MPLLCRLPSRQSRPSFLMDGGVCQTKRRDACCNKSMLGYNRVRDKIKIDLLRIVILVGDVPSMGPEADGRSNKARAKTTLSQ